MGPAFLPDFELTVTGGIQSGSAGTLMLTPRIGGIAVGELVEVSTLDHADRLCRTVILPDGLLYRRRG